MSKISIHKPDSIEYAKLSSFRDMANAMLADTDYYLTLDNIYFDAGQDWMYTSPVTHNRNMTMDWQSLCPRDYEILLACDTFEKMYKLAKTYVTSLLNNKQINFKEVAA